MSHKIRRRREGSDKEEELRLPDGFTGVLIATPVFGSQTSAGYARSLAGTTATLQFLGIPCDLFMVTGNALITNARDTIAAAFLSSGYSHLLMVDADMGWEPAAVVQLLTDARVHDVVLATYRKKRDEIAWTVRFREDLPFTQNEETGCVEVEYGGAGFCLVARTVIEKLWEAFPELRYQTREPFDEFRSGLFQQFQPAPGKAPWGEDAAFFARWISIGGHLWLDPGIDLKHFDGNRTYEAHTLDIFRLPDGGAGLAELAKTIRPALDIEGWLTEPQALALASAARRVERGSVVELGSWKGRSTAVLGLACKGRRHVVAVDNFTGSPTEFCGAQAEATVHPEGIFQQWHENIRRLDLLDTVTVVRSDSTAAAKDHAPADGIGLLFIDAEHTKERVLADFRAWEPHLLPGATVIFHDMDWLSVQTAISELAIPVEELHDMAFYTKPVGLEAA